MVLGSFLNPLLQIPCHAHGLLEMTRPERLPQRIVRISRLDHAICNNLSPLIPHPEARLLILSGVSNSHGGHGYC
jgi:hypothetical protein